MAIGDSWGSDDPARSITPAEAKRRKKRKGKADDAAAPTGPVVTEDSIALEMARQVVDLARYDHTAGRWLVWDGHIWRADQKGLIVEMVREHVRRLAPSLDTPSLKRTMMRRGVAQAIAGFMQSDRRLAVTVDDLDRDPLLLGCPGGVVDLRTGIQRPGRPEDLVTMSAAVDPAPRGTPAPHFDELLDWMTDNDQAEPGWDDYRRFVLAMMGYCLTGRIDEHLVFFVYGPGQNGKGTLLDTFQGIMGDYAVTAPMEMFIEQHNDRHPAELMLLRHKRLCRASEVSEGAGWNQQRLKVLSGGDPIAARAMGGDWEEFLPTHKLVLMADTRPTLRSVDDGIRRRIRLLPFVKKPVAVDKGLRDKLRPEWPAILRMAIDGWLDVQRLGGMPPCRRVEAETSHYLEGQDTLQQWMRDVAASDQRPVPAIDVAHRMFVAGDLHGERLDKVYGEWKRDCEAAGEKPGSLKIFRLRTEKIGFPVTRTNSGRIILGFKLRTVGDQGSSAPADGAAR